MKSVLNKSQWICVFLMIGMFFSIIEASANEAKSSAKNEINAYDPFADYSEFENTADEQDDIIFFQTGRFLSLSAVLGVQLFTMNMSSIYQPGFYYGAYLNYFFDLQFAIQFAITASSHRVQYQTTTGEAFLGASDIINIGVDFKYFLSKNLFHKNLEWLRPFLMLGTFHASKATVATLTNQGGYVEDSGFGVNFGCGTEFHFGKKIYFGLQYIFHFVTLSKEATPITLTTSEGEATTNFRPYGDWMTVSMLLGVNF